MPFSAQAVACHPRDGRAGIFDRPGSCLLILAVLSCAYFAPVFLHPGQMLWSGYNDDFLRAAFPWRYYAAAQWHATGSLPLWFLPGMCGIPFEADSQAQLFYPPYAILYAVPLDWIGPLYGFLLWAHVLLAGVGMYVYARHRGLASFAALVAGAIFMFSGKWLLQILHAGAHTFVPVAWFPWLLLCAECAIENRRVSYVVGLGALLAVVFTGSHPQMTLYMGFLAMLLSLRAVFSARTLAEPAPAALAVDDASRAKRLGWWTLAWCGSGVITAALVAIQLLPSLELLPYITRAQHISPHYSEDYDLLCSTFAELGQRLLSLAGPQNFGGNAESVGAFGLLGVGAALLALLMNRRWPVGIYGGALLLLVLFAVNSSTPVYPVLRRVVPGFALFRIPTRILMLAGFPLGMLTGCLTQQLFGAQATALPTVRRSTWLKSSAFFAVLAGVYLACSLRTGVAWLPYWKYLLILAPAMTLLLASRFFLNRGANLARLAWLILLTADLWGIHRGYLSTRPAAELFPETDLVRFVREHPGDYRLQDRNVPEQYPYSLPITQALCCMYDLEWVCGTNPTDLITYRQFLNFVAGRDVPPDLNEPVGIPPQYDQQLFDLFAVRYMVGPAHVPLRPDEAPHWRGVQLLNDNRVLTDSGFQQLRPLMVYERTEPAPRAFVVSQAKAAPERKELFAALKTTDLRQTVFLQAPRTRFGSDEPPVVGSFAGPPFQPAKVVSKQPNRVVVEVDRAEPGYLVLLDAWYPGWECHTADGQQLPVWQADSMFRAVLLPAGKQTVEFAFAPPTYRLGRLISLASLALLAVYGAVMAIRFLRAGRGRTHSGSGVAESLTMLKPAMRETSDASVQRLRAS